MDYISREKLRHAMYHEAFETDTELQKWESGCWIRYRLFTDVLDALPAEDVVERKVGKWIKVSDVSRFSPDKAEYRCSVCLANEEHAESADVPYCWHCGAKMEGNE